MRIYLFTIVAAVLILSISSCKKDDDTPASKSKQQLVSQKSWTISDVKMSPGITIQGFNITDAGMFIEECIKDNSYTFNLDSTITMNEGATKCSENSPQEVQDGTWVFNEDQSKMIFSDNEFLGHLSMDELTENKLILSRTEFISDTTITIPGSSQITIPGGDQKIILTFTH